MLALLISDPHFSDRPRDEFKWGLFPWLIKTLNQYNIDYLISLGDHTEHKDRHSAILTNKIVNAFESIIRETSISHVYLLRGNHDHLTDSAFFTFLNKIPKISFFTKPSIVKLNNNKIRLLFLPDTSNPDEDWKNVDMNCDYIFVHATFDGAISETGTRLSGISQDWFKDTKAKVYAGDTHLPQVSNRVTYVGATFQNRFNDDFIPRMILLNLETGEEENLYFETLKKHTLDITNINDLANSEFRENDQIKVRVHLDNITDWEETKLAISKYCEEHKLDLHQVELMKKSSHLPINSQKLKVQATPDELFELYCKKAEIDQSVIPYGKRILDVAK